MDPVPVSDNGKSGSNKLASKKAFITGGDSGIGKAVAILFAKEGADVAIVYTDKEEKDSSDIKKIIEEQYKRMCLLIPGDIKNESFCKEAVDAAALQLGTLIYW